MKPSAFFHLVEIRTKAASVIPFLTGTAWAVWQRDPLRPMPLVLFLVSMLCFDMFTTGLNNRMDHRRAHHRQGYNYERHNAIVRYELTPLAVDLTLGLLLLLATAAGLALVALTDLVVLAAGGFLFLAGILYSAGPWPLSRTPFGEAASGIAMGLGIPFLSWWIHAPAHPPLAYTIDWSGMTLSIHWLPLAGILWVSAPAILCIAGIMLANNLCDIEDDQANKRATLPVLIGKSRGLILLDLLYAGTFLSIPTGILLGLLPWICLLVLGVIPVVWTYRKRFHDIQTKEKTFPLAVRSFLIICFPHALLVAAGAWLP